ncbi:Hsp90 cochaperone SBA1 [Aspergillus homomorphus CBS 101889]|uniref:HSP20-like chaperone n=1 Tax=Aspergillus homomorphus (strain CBS 101889) TaxID=1450537 RepID=A0A395I4M1_ASPHC|nr:HSP20-like chaperone [Aspergillus homomorphus CBS 101889]RAL14533.1 HSP20-like chaperone [Aspergillus homomorphus CBS 101889]
MSLPQVHPEVTWAQRSSTTEPERNYLYVSIKAPDVARSDASLQITSNNVTFSGESKKGVKYQVSLDLFAEIDPEHSKTNHSDREVELVLRKKELKEEYWPRLLKTTQKVHFLKTDFDKWVDEDEQDEAPEDDYANGFGGMDAGDMAGGGGLGNIDFSKLGGLPGMNGGGFEAGEGDEEDEDMPELEEAGEDKEAKIKEVA